MIKITSIALACLCCCGCSFTHKPGKLLWADEFNYTGSLDSTRWNYELGNGCPNVCGWGNNEEEIYTQDLANAQVENGKLIIRAVKNNNQWTSARISTEQKVNFTYGWVEFRAKLPQGKGTWPALWMMSENKTKQGWPHCGEIDVMEHVGRQPSVVQSALHTTASHGNTVNVASTVVESFHSEFHLYQAHWTPEKLDFLVDDKVFYTYRPAVKDKTTWPFDSPFYILINLAMGGGLGGAIDPNLSAVQFEIDYVRIYQ